MTKEGQPPQPTKPQPKSEPAKPVAAKPGITKDGDKFLATLPSGKQKTYSERRQAETWLWIQGYKSDGTCR